MKVFIGVLSMGSVHAKLALSLLNMINSPNHTVEIAVVGAKRVEASRNIITKKFLESDADYLLMVDEDNPPIRNPLDTLKQGKDIICFPTPIFYDKQIVWNIDLGGRKQLTGLQEIKSGGTGCVLIKRIILIRLKDPFDTIVDKYGITTEGQDIRFCRLASEEGFKIWTHWGYPCDHYKTINLLDLA